MNSIHMTPDDEKEATAPESLRSPEQLAIAATGRAGIEIDEGWAWKKTPEELSRALTEVLSAQEGRTRAEHRAPRKV